MPLVQPIDLFTDALMMLGILGAAESTPRAEHQELCRRTYNRMVSQWNTRKRYSSNILEQSFTFSSSKNTYTIGAASNSPAPDFQVTSGNAPTRLEFAQVVLTDVSPNYQLLLQIIYVDQWQLIDIPTLTAMFPNTLYYVRPNSTTLNGTLRPWPQPTNTSYKLDLGWWDQLATVAAGALTTNLNLPEGYQEALTLSLAEKLWPAFPKKTDLMELSRQARVARGDIQSLNVTPPKISTTGGANGKPSGFNWLSREPN